MLRRSLALLLAAIGSIVIFDIPAKGAVPGELASVSEALVAARRTGVQVEVGSRKSATTRVWANPSGTLTAEIHGVPVRLKRNGQWLDYDMTLERRPDGTIAPRVHPEDLVLAGISGAGEHDLATVTVNGERFGLGWRGNLPEPVLSGATATYPEVLAGVDLVLEARDGGFEQFFVAKNRLAALRVAGLRMPMRTGRGNFVANGDGTGHWRDGRGNVVAKMPVALMWDSQGRNEAGEHRRAARVGLTMRAADAEIGIDQAWVNDPATQYPITIDPGLVVEKAAGFDEFVQNTISVSDNQSDVLLKLGYSDDSTCVAANATQKCRARSYLRFDGLSGYVGSKIYTARLYLYENHSWSCTAFGWRATRTNAVSGSVQWGSEPSWLETASTSTQTKGYNSSCADGWVYTDIAPLVPEGFAAGALSLAIHAVGDNGGSSWSVTDHNSWKKFDSNNAANKPKIYLEYNHVPVVSQVAVQGDDSCGAGLGQRKYLTDLTPSFSAYIKDDDKSPLPSTNVRLQVQLTPVGGTALPVQESPTVAPNATVTKDWVGNLDPTKVYSYQLRAIDVNGSGTQLDASAWSPVCEIGFDTAALDSAPEVLGLPTTVVDDISYNIVSVGHPVQVTFRPGPNDEGEVAGYRYSFDSDEVASPGEHTVPAGPDGTAQVTLTRWDVDGFGAPNTEATLYVRAVSITGTGTGDSTAAVQVFQDPAISEVPPATHIRGDVNGDGAADLAGYRSLPNGNGLFYAYPGRNNGTVTDALHLMTTNAYTASNSKPVQGDFSGDGKTDFAVFVSDGTVDVKLKALTANGNGLNDVEVWASKLAGVANVGKWNLTAMKVLAEDVNNDGLCDLVVAYANGTTNWMAKVFLAQLNAGQVDFADPVDWLTAAVAADWNKAKLVIGNFDGSGGADLAEFRDMGSCRTVLYVYGNTAGSGFATGVSKWDSTSTSSWCWASSQFAAGDLEVTGGPALDGIVSTYALTSCQTGLYIFRPTTANGSAWSAHQKIWDSLAGTTYWCSGATEMAVRDITGDGKGDLMVSYLCCGAYQQRVWTFPGTGATTVFGNPELKWQGALGPLTAGPVSTNGSTKYQLVAKHSGKCLTVPGAGIADSTALQQQTCSPTARHQQFMLEQRGAVYVRLHPGHLESKCLNISGGIPNDGQALIQFPCQNPGTSNESFQLEYVTGINYLPGDVNQLAVEIVSNMSGKCIGISGSALTDGAAAIQWTCNGSNDQIYYLRPLQPAVASIYGTMSDGRMTFTQIQQVTGDKSKNLTSTDVLGFTPLAMATLSLDTVLISSTAGALYRVDITGRDGALTFNPPVQLAASGWSHTQLTFDGAGQLFGITPASVLERFWVPTLVPQPGDIGAALVIDSGYSLNTLAAAGPNWIVGTTSAGVLRSYRVTGSAEWSGYSLVASGWTPGHLISPGNGVYYSHNTSTGALTRFLDNDPFNGSGTDLQSFATDPVDGSGWTQTLLSAHVDSSVGSFTLAGPAMFADDGDGTMSSDLWRSEGSQLGRHVARDNGTFDLARVGNRIGAGDVDGDGRSDVVIAQQNLTGGTFSFQVFRNGIEAPVVFYTSGAFDLTKVAGRMVVADFTADGKADVALFYDNGNGTMAIYRWTSTGTAFGSLVTFQAGTLAAANVGDRIAAGDVTGDGQADIVMAYDVGDGTFGFNVYPSASSSSGRWYTATFDISKVSNRFVVADFAGDTKADLAFAYAEGTDTRLYRWTTASTGSSFGAGTYVTVPGLDLSTVGDRIAVADLNGDNMGDLVLIAQLADGRYGHYAFPTARGYYGLLATSAGPFDLAAVSGRAVVGRW